ncbi:TPA: AAA family ATPase [Clostridioides difficile]|uniref:AAA family ATPase n=1 Tax=Clostridioides difficile TaxID=1496 RepID=UPI000B3C18E8|nr:AAA family ATPase [Clostridioides difficile]HBF8685585.1 AAA family ATPase [Clostridioides difficile]
MGLFKKAAETKSGIKILVFGGTGTGKTLFALSFNNGTICAIDTEDGMSYYKNSCSNLKYILNTTSADEIEEAFDEIEDELIDEIGTFVLDSVTKVYENMQHSALNVAERRARQKGQSVEDSSLSPREWGKIKLINKRIQAAKIKLASQGINVITIAQQKELKEKKGENYIITGYAPDCAKGIEYDFDVVLRFFTEKDAKTNEEIYKAEVCKDRTQTYKKGTIIENPSYENWKKIIEGKSGLKTEIIDFKKDIHKDENKIQSELEELDELLNELKTNMKTLDKTNQSKVVSFSKDLGVDNPLKCSDLEKMRKIVEYIKSL